jgi:hypothetical protein
MIYAGFNWELLDDPNFKEDSVREELISPLLTRLGYSASGSCKIVRSRALKHPFVYLGSSSHRIEIIPDYVLEAGGHPRWILDAKGPSENIYKGKNPQQAYSYAIHPDVRVRYFCLCNGREIAVFDIFRLEAVVSFPLRQIAERWEDLARLVGAEAFEGSMERLRPDLGLHHWRLGMNPCATLYFVGMGVGLVAKIEGGRYSIGGQYEVGEERFCASFDFDEVRYGELLGVVGEPAASICRRTISEPGSYADLRPVLPHVTICCMLGKNVEKTRDQSEEFCPFIVKQFRRFP